jgi:hypothetical protein
MGRMPGAMPKTIGAADSVRRSAQVPDARRKAVDLLQVLAAVECSFTVGGHDGVAPGLLRDLVIVATRLAGPAWLDATAETPAVASFTALTATRQPPPLPELDLILASMLMSRFAILVPAAA